MAKRIEKPAHAMTRRGFAASLSATAATAACGRVEDGTEEQRLGADWSSPPPPLATPASYPLAVSADRRHLVDASGRPFLVHGDTAWSLIADLPIEDAVLYLQDRRARGFNTILVNLLEKLYARRAPANLRGEPPFLTEWDYAQPNEAYFAHADAVLDRAAELGFLVMLVPSYLGHTPSEGWSEEMAANGPDTLRDYGRFVGRRYGDGSNILWVEGGDLSPADKAPARAVAEGIRESGARGLHTAHCGPGDSSLDVWEGESWLDLDAIYTYGSVADTALAERARLDGRMPFFLIESLYENEGDADAARLRTQAWHALLSGACGQMFGNSPIWHFEWPRADARVMDWRDTLDSEGARSMSVLRRFFESMPWTELEPDARGSLLVAGAGKGMRRAVAAATPDGRLAVVYAPDRRRLRLDLDRLVGPEIEAAWFDPASGAYRPTSVPRFRAAGARTFSPPERNDADGGDWALVLRSV
jgi:hypothetical protein